MGERIGSEWQADSRESTLIHYSFIHPSIHPTNISPGPFANQSCAGNIPEVEPWPQGAIGLEGGMSQEPQLGAGGEDDT